MEYYVWTPYKLAELPRLGIGFGCCCDEEAHTKCINEWIGCGHIQSSGYAYYKGNTPEEKQAEQERQASEAQARCHKVRVNIKECS